MIVLTGNGSEKLASAAREAGAVDYLTKNDLSPAVLNRSVRGALAGRKPR